MNQIRDELMWRKYCFHMKCYNDSSWTCKMYPVTFLRAHVWGQQVWFTSTRGVVLGHGPTEAFVPAAKIPGGTPSFLPRVVYLGLFPTFRENVLCGLRQKTNNSASKITPEQGLIWLYKNTGDQIFFYHVLGPELFHFNQTISLYWH